MLASKQCTFMSRNRICMHPVHKRLLKCQKACLETFSALDTTSVDPMFLQMYTSYICRSDESASCLMNMVIPVLEDQQAIVKQMISISEITTIDGLEGTFMKFLLMHDEKGADNLLNLAINYNMLLAAIRDVVSQVNG